jgi:hypothetical protein
MNVRIYDRPRTAGWRPYMFPTMLAVAVVIASIIGFMAIRSSDEQAAPTPYSDPDAPRPGIDTK